MQVSILFLQYWLHTLAIQYRNHFLTENTITYTTSNTILSLHYLLSIELFTIRYTVSPTYLIDTASPEDAAKELKGEGKDYILPEELLDSAKELTFLRRC